MNILFLMGVYPNYGGVEKVSTILANAFIEKGYWIVFSLVLANNVCLCLIVENYGKEGMWKIEIYYYLSCIFDLVEYCSRILGL